MPDKYPLGLNINLEALRDWNHLVRVCRMLNSKYHLVRWSASGNGQAEALSAKRLYDDIGDSELTFIVRIYSPLEGQWKKFNINDYVAYCQQVASVLPNVIFDAPANEPGVPPNDIPDFVNNQLALIRKFKEKGLRYAAMCFGVGSPEWQDVFNGGFDAILREADYISEHHYTMGWLEAGSGVGYDVLLDPEKLRQYWIEKWDIKQGHYLVRRSDYWKLQCDKIGVDCPEVLLTEVILDQIPDTVSYLNNQYNGAWDGIRNTYGLQQYNHDLRGLNSYEKYYKSVFPELSYNEALAKVHTHYVEDCLYVDYIGGGMIFAWDTLWDIPHGTDASVFERLGFFTLLAEHAKTYTKTGDIPDDIPIPIPEEIIMIPKTIRAVNERVRIRQKPTILNSQQLGWIEPLFIDALVSDKTWIEDGYIWYRVEYSGLVGYAAFEAVNGGSLIEIQENDDVPEPDTIVMSKADYESLKAIIEKYDT